MHITVTRFSLGPHLTVAQARELFEASAPRYRTLPGLIHKSYYIVDAQQVGGVYTWRDRAAADAFFTAEWSAGIVERFGSAPTVTALPVVLHVDAGA